MKLGYSRGGPTSNRVGGGFSPPPPTPPSIRISRARRDIFFIGFSFTLIGAPRSGVASHEQHRRPKMMKDKGLGPTRRLLAATAALFLAPALWAAAPCTDNPWTTGWTAQWTPLFQGIEWTSACTTLLANGQPGTRTQPMNALRIDLQAPGLGFVASTRDSIAQARRPLSF